MCNNYSLCGLHFETNWYNNGPIQSIDRIGRGVDCGKSMHNSNGGYVWTENIFDYIVDGLCGGPHRSSILLVFESNRLWFDQFGICTISFSRIRRFYRFSRNHPVVTCTTSFSVKRKFLKWFIYILWFIFTGMPSREFTNEGRRIRQKCNIFCLTFKSLLFSHACSISLWTDSNNRHGDMRFWAELYVICMR